MITVDYRLIRGVLDPLRAAMLTLSRMVTRRSRANSQLVSAPPEAARPAAPPEGPPAVASATECDQALIATHLEYLAYELRMDADGWSQARHPARYNFHLRTFACGTRLHCEVGIGASIGNSRAAWIEFLNQANDRGYVTRFSLVEYPDGRRNVRMRALVAGAYSRSVFAMAMDMWHEDLDLVRLKPEFPKESTTADREVAAAVTVN
jgi:hypothetical protein